MEVTDRERWDGKYRAQEGRPLEAADAFVVEALERIGEVEEREPRSSAARRALDIAAGRGRHTLELLRRGYAVEAWDVSPIGLTAVARAAREAGHSVATREVDLLALLERRSALAELAGAPFELVCVAWFLHRPLLAELPSLVVPGGWAIVRTATVDRAGCKPPLAYCLERGELAAGLAGFETLWHEEAGGRAGLVARRT